ncbi:MAG: tetratricopeptide repeat protein [Reyranellaceae bacterium]
MRASRFVAACAAFGLALSLGAAGPALAMGSNDPAPAAKPRNADFDAGKAAVAKEDWAAAIAALKKATAAEPNNPEAHNLLGYATRKSGDARGSLAHYQQALALDPKHLGAHEYIGEAYLMLNDVAKAEEHLAKLSDLCTFGCKEERALKAAIAAWKAKPKQS